MNKRNLKYQQIIVLLFIAGILYYGWLYYHPWITALIKGSFIDKDFNEMSYNIIKSESGFYMRFFWQTLRFLSLSLLLVGMFKYFNLIQEFEKKRLFTEMNYKTLMKCGNLFMMYSAIIFMIRLFDPGKNIVGFGLTVFIGSTLLTFGEVFKRAYLNKKENDLTI